MKKVASGTATVYIFSGTRVLAEYQNGAAPGSPTREYIYGAGYVPVAKIESGAVQYYHPGELSVRMMADSSGNVIGQQAHYPFGESWYQTNTTTKWFFTNYERDAESGNDYASFRYDVNRLGRFASPDLLAGSIDDPQTLNRYPYVRGDPVNLVDPLGLDDNLYCDPDTECGDGGGSGGAGGGGSSGGGGGGGGAQAGGPPCPSSYDNPGCDYLQWMFDHGCQMVSWDGFIGDAVWDCSGSGGPPIPADPRARGGLFRRFVNAVKAVVNKACSAIPDASYGGAGGDLGLGSASGGTLTLTSNGRTGEVSGTITGTQSGGIISPDAYLTTGVIPSLPSNASLQGSSITGSAGVQRYGVTGGGGGYGVTFGPSLLPVTAAVSATQSTNLFTIPYAGYVLNPARAACKAATGH